ncbi:MAG: transcriptional repressor [Thermodesulfobacteriota bacterium]|nr:transcriptional repressor [Thermodesulfobacteriota bacterium]
MARAEQTKTEIDVFREFVRKKGLRNTPERETIIKEIFATHDHFDVDELYLRLRKKNKKISKPSIYRLIPYLLECGLIQEAYFEDGHLHYEHIYGHEHHCHLRCVGCGKTFEFSEKSLKRIEKKLGEKYGFAVQGHKFEVFGYCPKCKAHM